MNRGFMKVAFLSSQDVKVAFLNRGFMKVAFLNPAGRRRGRGGSDESTVLDTALTFVTIVALQPPTWFFLWRAGVWNELFAARRVDPRRRRWPR